MTCRVSCAKVESKLTKCNLYDGCSSNSARFGRHLGARTKNRRTSRPLAPNPRSLNRSTFARTHLSVLNPSQMAYNFGRILTLSLVGTARCAVRTRKAGAKSAANCYEATIPAALPPGTPQRGVPANEKAHGGNRGLAIERQIS